MGIKKNFAKKNFAKKFYLTTSEIELNYGLFFDQTQQG